MSDIVGHNEPLTEIICNNCKNYLREKEDLSCLAFDRIPDSILDGDINHDKPLPGQKNNIVFETDK